MILNGRAVIAAPKQYFRKPRCHGLKNLEDEARAISTEAKKGLEMKRFLEDAKQKKGISLWSLGYGFSCFVFVVVVVVFVFCCCCCSTFFVVASFLSSEAGQPK